MSSPAKTFTGSRVTLPESGTDHARLRALVAELVRRGELTSDTARTRYT